MKKVPLQKRPTYLKDNEALQHTQIEHVLQRKQVDMEAEDCSQVYWFCIWTVGHKQMCQMPSLTRGNIVQVQLVSQLLSVGQHG